MATSTDTPAQGAYTPFDSPSPMVEDIESFPRIHTGVGNSKPVNDTALSADATKADDPFASQRDGANAFGANGADGKATGLAPSSPTLKDDRRLSSDEWGE